MSLVTFASQALSNYQQTAAILPSSRYLARAMVQDAGVEGAKRVVELGPGTGVVTSQLLKTLPKDAELLAFEISPAFSRFLKKKFNDPRLTVLNVSAEKAGEVLAERGWENVDAVFSSLGMGFLGHKRIHAILGGLEPHFHDKTVLAQYQYIHGMQVLRGRLRRYDARDDLRQYFPTVRRRIIWRNVPPTYVLLCHR